MAQPVGSRTDALSQLLRTIRADETSIPMISTSPFQDVGRLNIEGERIRYTSKTPTTFEGCTRGADLQEGGTGPLPHPGGALVAQDTASLKGIIHDEILVPQRSALALYEGSGIDLTLLDNPTLERSEITIASLTLDHGHTVTGDGGLIPFDVVWLATNTPSAASTSSFDNVFTTTYDHYLVRIRLALSASNASLAMRFRVSAADSSAGSYGWTSTGIDDAGSAANSASTNMTQTSITLVPAPGVGVTVTDVAMTLFVMNPQDASTHYLTGTVAHKTSTPHLINRNYGASFNAATQFDGLSIFPSSGTITGSIRVAGWRD